MARFEGGKIFYQDFFKFDYEFMQVLSHNVGQLLMFVLPIIFLGLSIIYSRKFIRIVKDLFNQLRRYIKGSSKDSFQSDRNYEKELNRQRNTYTPRRRRAYNRKF